MNLVYAGLLGAWLGALAVDMHHKHGAEWPYVALGFTSVAAFGHWVFGLVFK